MEYAGNWMFAVYLTPGLCDHGSRMIRVGRDGVPSINVWDGPVALYRTKAGAEAAAQALVPPEAEHQHPAIYAGLGVDRVDANTIRDGWVLLA